MFLGPGGRSDFLPLLCFVIIRMLTYRDAVLIRAKITGFKKGAIVVLSTPSSPGGGREGGRERGRQGGRDMGGRRWRVSWTSYLFSVL